MSASLVLFSEAGIIPKIKSATVLDFDERILNGILKCRDKHSAKIEMNLEFYNVIEPIPKKYQEKFDFFYINPPYGSKNVGLSSIVWLYRCMDLIKKDAEGIIVIPYDSNIEWTKDAMVRIQKFLIDNGFVIKEMITDLHYYHLDDNPKLTSSSLLVERTAYKNSKYQDKYMPFELVKNLYGDFLKIPRYIYDDNTLFEKPHYDWKYGDENWK